MDTTAEEIILPLPSVPTVSTSEVMSDVIDISSEELVLPLPIISDESDSPLPVIPSLLPMPSPPSPPPLPVSDLDSSVCCRSSHFLVGFRFPCSQHLLLFVLLRPSCFFFVFCSHHHCHHHQSHGPKKMPSATQFQTPVIFAKILLCTWVS